MCYNEKNIDDMYDNINTLIKNQKMKFKFYNSYEELEILQVCRNKVNNVIEVYFRNIQKEYINELKEVMNKMEILSK